MKKSLEALVKRAARKAGLTNWKDVYPHCLRKAFEGALRNSGMHVKDQEFLMGHILPRVQDAYYDNTKVEELRRKFGQVVFFSEKGFSEDQRKRQVLDTVKLLGYSDQRIKRVEEALAKFERVDDALNEIKKLRIESDFNPSRQNYQTNSSKSVFAEEREVRIIKGEDKLVHSLNHNLSLLKELSDQRFIIKKL